jgi:CRP-like cAMP-binding protein
MTVKLALASVPIFQFVAPEQLKRLVGLAKIVEKAPGEAVVMHDENVIGVYLVGEGSVGVYPPGAAAPLVILQSGEAFGEMSFLEKTKASATIRAEAGGAKVALFLQSELAQAAEADPELGRCLYRGIALTLSRRLRATTDKISREVEEWRRALTKLQSRNEERPVLRELPAQVLAHVEAEGGLVDECLKIVAELAKKVPERGGSLGELDQKLGALRTRSRQALLDLHEQVAVLTSFVRSMEDFVARSSGA